MVIKFHCECGQPFELSDEYVGYSGNCPNCGEPFVVPPRRIILGDTSESDEVESRPKTTQTRKSKRQSGPLQPGSVVFQPRLKVDKDTSITLRSVKQAASRRGKKKSSKKTTEAITVANAHRVYMQSFMESLAFPFRGDGKWTLLVWSGVYGGSHGLMVLVFSLTSALLFGSLLLITLIGIPVLIILVGYFGAYLLQVLRAAAGGEDELPNIAQQHGITSDLFKWFWCLGIGLGPLSVYEGQILFSGGVEDRLIYWACLAFAVFYTPMALLSTTLFDNFIAANPLTVVTAIVHMPLDYAITCVLIISVLISENWLVESFPMIPPFSQIAAWFVALYGSMVVMHLLGTAYYRNRECIGWFRHE